MARDVTFYIGVVFSYLLCSMKERSDVGQSMVKIGDGDILIGSTKKK